MRDAVITLVVAYLASFIILTKNNDKTWSGRLDGDVLALDLEIALI